jgi:hypothetical protein
MQQRLCRGAASAGGWRWKCGAHREAGLRLKVGANHRESLSIPRQPAKFDEHSPIAAERDEIRANHHTTLAPVIRTAYGVSKGWRRGPARRETSMKIPTVRAGAHIEGVHWIAEYAEDVHEIRVFREGQEVDVHNAPSTLFGDEENAGSKSTADHRAVEAAVLAYLRRFVIEHDAEE